MFHHEPQCDFHNWRGPNVCLFCKNGMQVVIWSVMASPWTGRFPMMKRNRRGESSGRSTPRAQNLVMRTSGRSVKLQCVTTTAEVWLLSTCQPRTFKRQKHFILYIPNNDFFFLSHLLVPWVLKLEPHRRAYKVTSSWSLWAWADFRHLPLASFTTPPQFPAQPWL